MRLLLLSIILLTPMIFLGQEGPHRADTLLARVHREQSPLEKIAMLDSLCSIYLERSEPGGAPLFELRRNLLEEHLDVEEVAKRTTQTTFYFVNTGEIEKAHLEVATTMPTLDRLTSQPLKADVLYSKSAVEEQLQNNASALDFMNQCIDIHEVLKDSSKIQFGDSYRAKGRILLSMGKYAEAAIISARARSIFLATKDSIGIADTDLQLGIIYAQIGLFDESKKYFEGRYKYIPNAGPIMKVRDLINLGRNDLVQGNYAEGKRQYEDALAFLSNFSHDAGIAIYAYNGLIEASYFNGNRKEVPVQFQKMMALVDSLPTGTAPSFLIEQSRFFEALVSEDFTEAERIGNGLYMGSLKKKDASEALLHAQFLAELYKQSGDYKNALAYSEIYNAARDSTLSSNKTNALLLFQTQYETREKELKIAQLAVEKKAEASKAQSYLWIAGLLATLLLVGGWLIFQLKKARLRLELQNKELQVLNMTKNKFFGIIGHDLGGPLTILSAIGNRISRQVQKKEFDKVEESVHRLTRTSNQLNDLLDNLLKWALTQNGVMPYQPENLNVNNLAQECASIFSETAKDKGVQLELLLPDNLHVYADRNALSGIMRNLLSNAIKFTPKEGRVSLSGSIKKDHIEITVNDSGVGISEEQIAELNQAVLFSKQGTDGESGTGLGLVLVKELVQINRGELLIKSTPNRGSAFSISLPKP